ncbi:Lipid-A-disaccharide synthase [Gemmata sp. SH-PL17]|uniref:lipid-A-disaccharide synthase n=1 Tax=Gemmata sp. SH-PL17 TaxID=1630693 RepID=UPI00078DF761|nr:lipid-A-disaccharide synthase [Gemmata sp. SH-PL17]AMV24834.1 Lipid-A-disaccharide synthase [Gemmata sp. SH-PL17]
MKLFLSAGEPSGDLHGSNLIRSIRAAQPDAQITAFGGERIRAAGAQLLYPLANFAVMGIKNVVRELPTFFHIGDLGIRHIRTQKPDAVVMIDYPGFHLALAKRIRDFGVPTYFFVPPQIWAWRQGRVRTVRKCFTGVLTALPFEDDWYRARGVKTHYIGHPYFDELAQQQLDPGFMAQERARPGVRVAILPGSRNSEVAVNAAMMLAAAQKVHAARPDARFLVAAFNSRQADAVRAILPPGLPVEVCVGRTPEIIELAEACIAVSGSVSLELMYRAKPTVVVYRVGPVASWVLYQIIKARYMSLVNLLLNEELFPEFATSRDKSSEIAEHILGWLNDPSRRAAVVDRLVELRSRAAVPGACDRAAAFLLGASQGGQTRRAA